MKPCVFLAYSISKASVSDYFTSLAIHFSHTHTVIICTDTDKVLEETESIKVYKWPSKRPTKWKDFRFLHQKIKMYKPEIMISVFGAVNMFLIGGFVNSVKHRIAWRRTLVGQLNPSRFSILRKQFMYKMATEIYANSKATKKDIVEHFNVPSSKVKVVYNAVKDYGIMPKEKRPYQLVYAGRLHTSKGIDTLLEALPAVVKLYKNVELLVLGGSLTGNAIKKYQQIVDDIDIKENVRFLGNQPKEKVLEIFANSQVTIVPSLVEAFGFVVIESFSVGTPVIGSNTTGIAEIIRDGKDGLLFEPDNSKALSQKIIHILSSPKQQRLYSKSCYERFKKTFEVECATKALVKEFHNHKAYV